LGALTLSLLAYAFKLGQKKKTCWSRWCETDCNYKLYSYSASSLIK
jgi:hypothetical protein